MWQRNNLSVKQRFEEDFEFEGFRVRQSLETEPPSCVYDAAIIMAKYLTRRACQQLQGKTVLELGAGCGLTGIYLSRLVGKGILTDVPSVVPLIQTNIEANGCADKLQATSLFWGDQRDLDQVMQMTQNQVDYVVGGDIVFDFENFEGLCGMLEQLFAKCGTKQAFIGYTHRFGDVEGWFKDNLKKRSFSITEASDIDEEYKAANFTILILSKL